VAIGQGVGLGMVLDGAPYRGAAGAAGEFGHLPLVPDGLPCVCGNRGCLETLVSTEALLRRATELGVLAPGDDDLAELRAAADRGEAVATQLLAEAGAILGRALGGAVNLLGPEAVFIVGEIAEVWPHLAGAFREALDASLLPCVRETRIDVREWDDSLVAFGAAGIVLSAPLAARRQTQPPVIRRDLATAAQDS
jgi:predicted NBD/HSP70 family sugar kinase